MKRPILFNDEMVRAIREGRKTQTRRIIKGVDPRSIHTSKDGRHLFRHGDCGIHFPVCPYGNIGDHLWVRETWAVSRILDFHAPRHIPKDTQVYYLADGLESFYRRHAKTRASIHMPRWASRILLEITDIRVERLHDISEDDAKAEGVEVIPQVGLMRAFGFKDYTNGCAGFFEAKKSFLSLWHSIYGDANKNPLVWAITFKVVAQ